MKLRTMRVSVGRSFPTEKTRLSAIGRSLLPTQLHCRMIKTIIKTICLKKMKKIIPWKMVKTGSMSPLLLPVPDQTRDLLHTTTHWQFNVNKNFGTGKLQALRIVTPMKAMPRPRRSIARLADHEQVTTMTWPRI